MSQRILVLIVALLLLIATGIDAVAQRTGQKLPGNQITLGEGYELTMVSPNRVRVRSKYTGGRLPGKLGAKTLDGDYLCFCESNESQTACATRIRDDTINCVPVSSGSCDTCVLAWDRPDGEPPPQTQSVPVPRQRVGGAETGKAGSIINGRATDTAPPAADARLDECEARSRELASRVAELERRVGATAARSTPSESAAGAGGATGAPEPVEGGYQSVWFKAGVSSGQLRVMVNGRTVGTYDQSVEVYLDTSLKRGEMNTITFAYSSPGASDRVEIQVQSPVDGRWQTVFNFKPNAAKPQDSFDVPFAGAGRTVRAPR